MKATFLAISMMLTTSFLAAQSVAVDSASPAPTRTEVDHLLTVMHTGDAQTPMMHTQLETKFKTLPPWFPRSVWDDVEMRVESIHYADACLAVYQKYMTSAQVQIMSSIFEGPTGEKIADIMSGMASKAVQEGHTGYESDKAVGQAMKGDVTIPTLMAQRFAEMKPEQRAKVQANLSTIQKLMQPVEDGCQAAYNAKASVTITETLAKHSQEIAKAQQAYSAKH